MDHTVDLHRISERLATLLGKEYDFLSSFWNDTSSCFARLNPSLPGVSVASTCRCLDSILGEPDLKRAFLSDHSSGDGDALARVANALLKAKWKSKNLPEHNLYTMPMTVATLLRLGKVPPDHPRIVDGLERILANVEDRGAASADKGSDPSAFLTYWCAGALRSATDNDTLRRRALRRRCDAALERTTEWAEAEVYRQLAFHSAADYASFDAMQAAFALVIYVEGYLRKGRKPNERIVTTTVGVIFSNQLPDGLWPKYRPVFHYQKKGGSAYAFLFEMLDTLLALGDRFPYVFKDHLKGLEASLHWAEQNVLIKEGGRGPKGWRASHMLSQGGPEGWSTAAVFSALRRFQRLVRLYLNEDVLSEFNATRISVIDRARFDQLYDSTFMHANVEKSLKDTVRKYLIDPHLPNGTAEDKRYSAILFGPPGVAKTSLAEAVAYSLGWPFIHLQTSDFLSEGMGSITGRARTVFDRLKLLEQVVILFDEVEEFVRDRDKGELESRLMTTAMLTLIQDLRRRAKVIFIVATNRLSEFDSAVTRSGGRFDLVLLVAPPSLKEKVRMFEARLKTEPVGSETATVLGAFEEFVEKQYTDLVQYFTYNEWGVFIAGVLKDPGPDGRFTPQRLEELLKSRASTIALQGTIRDDFEKFKDKSRID